ncbi:DMSO/selenate family reductase complex A subunit [Endozoicomonas elysicola]|uniref:Dimethyl sulfoxide reductase n=1 Tax=Endozoicomonas elysicola TaxID=305900 RepID=A0A081K8H1_9GAMM|nr:DMSO/selenate family reductase complex A subunit [Endozoicomonas elysicola]KEI70447.1 dimethyl sulfoxide reductase [Endozoicomonas elysicola]
MAEDRHRIKTASDRFCGDGISRRTLLKSSALAGGAGLVMAGLPFQSIAKEDKKQMPDRQTREVWSSCMVNCQSRCPIKYHVEDGVIVRCETDSSGDDKYSEHQVRACLRGRSSRRRIYNPDRLKYPMKRVGKRGEGKFERISWDEAFDTIVDALKRTKAQYGNEAIYINRATGLMGATLAASSPPANSQFAQLMNLWGGWLNHYGTYSTAQIRSAFPTLYGDRKANGITDIANTRLYVVFGHNPAETRTGGGGVMYHLEQARKKHSVRMIVIDPRYTDTCLGKEDEWVPIRPGTDPALIAGMAHVMIRENLVDQHFLDTYCMGYDHKTLPEGVPANSDYKSYILGKGPDGLEKTPQWAEQITGIPAERITKLAREIAMAKPAHITQGWGPQRQANGEQSARAIGMLAALTGNVGIPGGNSGHTESSYDSGYPGFPGTANPVKTSISVFTWMDAILDGENMTATNAGVRGKDQLGVPIKFFWNYAGNIICNQHSDINNTHKVLQDETRCEMIVVIDNHMTSSARFADILLPDVSTVEREDIAVPDNPGNMDYRIYCSQVIEPMFECKNIYEICTELAKRLGIEKEYTQGRNECEWLKHIHALAGEAIPGLPAFDEFRELGIIKFPNRGHAAVAFKDFREDPVKHPLKTPSGKIEIYSQVLAEAAATWTLPEGDVIKPLPEYVRSYRGFDDPLTKQFPLQMIGYHTKSRVHSTYDNVDILREALPDKLWMNPVDAEQRGLLHGQRVEVFNDKGRLLVPLKVTSRIMPGVCALPEGSWYRPDRIGLDRGGCINTLTYWGRPSPYAKGNPQHTNLVEVKAWQKGA